MAASGRGKESVYANSTALRISSSNSQNMSS